MTIHGFFYQEDLTGIEAFNKCQLFRVPSAMTFEDIYAFHSTPQPVYLNQELTVCYVLSVLLKGDSYGTEMIQIIEQTYPPHCLSDTVLYAALNFLVSEQVISSYQKKVEGRGRPRRMYQLNPERRDQAVELAGLWENYSQRALSVSAGVV